MGRNYYQDFARMQRHGEGGTSAKDSMRTLGYIGMIASGCFWFPIQWAFVAPANWGDVAMALGGGLILVVAPPVLLSFLIPWSSAGMLLASMKWRTVGQSVVLAASLYLLYYSWMVLSSWWAARPMVAESNLTSYQAIIGIIAYILVPALLWAPVGSEEMAEELKQDQLVKRYKIQTAADIAILEKTLFEAQQKALIGFANLTAGERDELAAVMQGLVMGIDQTIQEIAGNINQATGLAMEFAPLTGDDRVARLLATAANAISTRMVPVEAQQEPVYEASMQQSTSLAVAPHAQARAVLTPEQARGIDAARRELEGRAWMRRDIERVLTVEKTKASQLITAWRLAGYVAPVSDPKDHYIFVA